MASWRPALVMQQDSTFKKKVQETRNATNCVPQGVLYFLFLEIIDRWAKLFGNKSCFAHLLALRWVTDMGSSLLGRFAYTKSQAKVRQENPFLCKVEWQQTHRWEIQQPWPGTLKTCWVSSLPVRASNIAAGKRRDGLTFKGPLPSVCLLDQHDREPAQWCTPRLSPETGRPVVSGG